MPNYITNFVTITGKADTLYTIMRDMHSDGSDGDVFDEPNDFDFKNIIPIPPDGEANDYWGSCSNSLDVYTKVNADTLHTLLYKFKTTWSNPAFVIRELSKKYNVTVECRYYDEDFGYNVGTYVYINGILAGKRRLDEKYDEIAKVFGEDVMKINGMVFENGRWKHSSEY